MAKTWIKLRLASGTTGFVSLADLITPQQLSARSASMKKASIFEADVATATRAEGTEVPSGIYTHGGSCDAPDRSNAASANYLRTKVLIWQEGGRMHFVQVLQPDDPTIYDIQNDNQTRELQGFGYVPMRTFRSSKDSVLMGFKNKLLWFTTDGNRFDSYLLCGSESYALTVNLLRDYASQRPPEILPNGSPGAIR